MAVNWNPWHGCTKLSSGCKHCYVYRSDARHGRDASVCVKTNDFYIPVKKKKDGSFKAASGELVWTCFTSDFLLDKADPWRNECWDMIRQRRDLFFMFITKRIDRFEQCKPSDWGNGWDNVEICCTVENQDRADYRLPIYLNAPIKYKTIVCEPLLEKIDVSKYLIPGNIAQLVTGGESGLEARECDYDWILSLRDQCGEAGINFTFRQTGAHFRKDGILYNIPRRLHHVQARKAGLGLSFTQAAGLAYWRRKVLPSVLREQNEKDQMLLF